MEVSTSLICTTYNSWSVKLLGMDTQWNCLKFHPRSAVESQTSVSSDQFSSQSCSGWCISTDVSIRCEPRSLASRCVGCEHLLAIWLSDYRPMLQNVLIGYRHTLARVLVSSCRGVGSWERTDIAKTTLQCTVADQHSQMIACSLYVWSREYRPTGWERKSTCAQIPYDWVFYSHLS